MIKISFADVPLVPLMLRPTGRLALVHSGPFLYNDVCPSCPSLSSRIAFTHAVAEQPPPHRFHHTRQT